MSAQPSLRMGDLYSKARALPTRDEYRQQLRRWCELAERKLSPAELAAIQADQARRIKAMEGR